jgi:hypothetical protein
VKAGAIDHAGGEGVSVALWVVTCGLRGALRPNRDAISGALRKIRGELKLAWTIS